ncbi:centrosomal protein of 128 kDa isoform X2 [Acanthochromis polyacanthus]|uniref:centrosomal protein of 128 kDa isoform X2 n=1 Tax=Acanthochromis polyacanthus TaxID=80966 RepID=UPI002234BAC1|nr:centrosomal protein of 128 kDa isoform X2 [Acanthochromis polyacanthus]
MDTSSGSDSYDRMRTHRPRGRETHRKSGRDRGRASGSGIDGPPADISEKISTLANTLQDTSRNLTKVDRMLGQYREHTDDQAEAMALLRENLEESISQLQAQRLSRANGTRSASASASTLHTSDLDACSESEGQRFYPTSPLKDYTGTPGRRRRSHSASVRFKESSLAGEDIHEMHQSLRDLRCNQQRLSDDLDREILRRNRSDIDTRRAMESLTEHMTASQRQDSVSSRVERRLQELQREIHNEQRSVERERRPEQRVAMSDELQEALGRRQVQSHERDEDMTARLLKAEREKSKMEQELDRARRLLEQSEDSRESLAQEVEDMRCELLRTKKENTGLQRARLETSQPSAQPHGNHSDREGGRAGLQDRSDLEKEVAELRVQLCKVSVQSEVEELRRALNQKEKERVELSLQVKELSSDLAAREQQQLRMLEQLRDIQSRGPAERREMEALLQESTRSRDELKARAQEAVRQWRAKCRRLQKGLDEAQAQAAREKGSSQAQLKALSQQTEAARRELAEILGRLAQREEELHRKDVELSETHQRQLSLQQEIREVREASATLEEEARHQAAILARLREENQRLEERADTQVRRCQRDQDAQAELQAALKQMTTARAQLAQRLAEEESSRKELHKGTSELQAKVTALQEERDALSQQLQLEREVHQKELDNTKATAEDSRIKKDREVQDMLRLCRQERDEMQSHLREVKADAASDKELCGALHVKLDRMKDECDKLAAQLSTKDEAYALLHRKYQLLKQELEDKVRSGERRRASESELVKLEQKVLQMEAEQEAVLTSMGEELDAACHSLARNGEDKLQAISQRPSLVKDPHRWLAETKTKLRWLCEEVRDRDTREQRLRRQHQQTRDQLKALRQSRDSEQATLLQRLDQQEKLMHSLSVEKKELLERSRRKEDEMRSLQDRVLDLEMNTRVALDHLESIPEKPCLMENFKDLEESQQQRESVEQRYTKYKEIVWDLQHQLDESKRRIQEYRDEKLDATSRSLRLAALSSSIKDSNTFLSSSLRSDTLSPHKRLTSSDLDASKGSKAKPLPD